MHLVHHNSAWQEFHDVVYGAAASMSCLGGIKVATEVEIVFKTKLDSLKKAF